MDELAGITIRLAPLIEAKVAEAAERFANVADIAWWMCAAVAAAAVAHILKSIQRQP